MNWTYDDLLLLKLQGCVLHFGEKIEYLQAVVPLVFIVMTPSEPARMFVDSYREDWDPAGCGPTRVYLIGFFRNCKDVEGSYHGLFKSLIPLKESR
jgi:hypothetical protein